VWLIIIIIIIIITSIHQLLAHGARKNITPTHKSSSFDANKKITKTDLEPKVRCNSYI
jgi:uncharacterized protein YpmB